MQALTIAHVDAERGFSGGEVQVFLLMNGLRQYGHRNLLLCPPGSAAEREALRQGFDVRPVRASGDLDLPAVVRLKRAMVDSDIVHLHTGRATWLGGLAARLAGKPAITTRRMDRRVRRGLRTGLIYNRLVRHAVAISPAVARRLAAGGISPERISVIPSAVDVEALRPTQPREQIRADLGVAPADLLLLTMASLVRRKGIDVLLEALAGVRRRVAAARLLVAGDGPERARLEAQVRNLRLGNRAIFLGRRSDVGDLLAAADVFVLPSHLEGLGVAALEAMAVARPVVASRVGGLAEVVVDGQTGLLVKPGDAVALAAALERILTDADLRRHLGSAGPARVAGGHLPEQMVAAYEDLYDRVLGLKPWPDGAAT